MQQYCLSNDYTVALAVCYLQLMLYVLVLSERRTRRCEQQSVNRRPNPRLLAPFQGLTVSKETPRAR